MSPVSSLNASAPEHRQSAAQQAKPGVDLLGLPSPILEDHLWSALRQEGILDVFALTSRAANTAITQWRVRECFREIAAGMVLQAPEDPEDPGQGAARIPDAPAKALGQQGSALRALRRMHQFLVGHPGSYFEMEGLKQKPSISSVQLLAHLDKLRSGASARMEAGGWSTWLTTCWSQQRVPLLQSLWTLRDHFMLPLRTWTFANSAAEPIAFSLAQRVAKDLTTIDLKGHEDWALVTLPPLACYFRNLQTALLNKNQFVRVPEEVMLFEHLEVLELSNNRLQKLPDELARLQRLKDLRLHNNALTTLCPAVFGLNSLQVLTLNDNPVVDAPHGYVFAPSLKTLIVDNASLPALGPALSGASGLEEVTVTLQQTEQHVSAAIGALFGVQSLRLWTGAATTLPPEIGKLQALKTLTAGGMHLLALPEEIGELHNLEGLKLFAYEMTALPQSLVKCQKLRNLDLSDTGVLLRPPQTLQMPNLTEVLLAYGTP